MTSKLNVLPQDKFVAIWNATDSLDDAVAEFWNWSAGRAQGGAVLARALACRKDGIEMKPLDKLTSKVA